MKFKRIVSAALAACLLAGCSNQPTGVDDLLRAPQFGGSLQKVQKALTSYLGEAPQLKYPNLSIDGEAVSPFRMEDFNGDGKQDAAVFYVSAAKGQNVHMAILEQKSTGEWFVTQEKEGLAPAVESVSTAELQQDEGRQLIVGYAGSSGEKYLAVYAYGDSTLSEVLTQPYSQYQLHPLSSTEASDLVVIGPEQPAPLQLQLLTAHEGRYDLAQQLTLREEFVKCSGLYPSEGEDGSRFLILDGQTATGLASLILRYDNSQQQLENFTPTTETDLFGATQRFSSILHSADLDGDGRVEIPCQTETEGVGALTVNKLTIVSWMDFTSAREQEKRFGVADLEYGYFLALPSEMKGNILIVSGDEPDSWQVRSLDGEKLYITVRVVAPHVQGSSYVRLGNIGAQKVQARVAPGSGVTANELVGGFYVL